MTHHCPICGTDLQPIARYPRYVCSACAGKATTAEGRPLDFFNIGLSGGYGAQHADDGSPYDSHDCFIGGQPCRADEARFGGIVIETVEAMPDWSNYSDKQLLSAYCSLMAALRDRGVVRSSNNPVADYTESLVSRALGLSLESQSQAGYDALDSDGRRYQIKGRRLTSHNTSPQLSAIRNLDKKPFDLLAAVAYDANLSVLYAALIPISIVSDLSRYTSHTNSHTLIFKRSVLDNPLVTDITALLGAA